LRETEAIDTPPIEIVVTASARKVRVDQALPLTVSAINRTDRPQTVLPSLDASDVGWRYPKIDIEIRDARGQLVVGSGIGRCGLVNPLVASDFIELAPGAHADLLGKGTFGHFRLGDPTLAPGVYTVTLRYDLRFDQPDRGAHDDVDDKIATLPKGVYASAPITIEVTK
jgi:hypothetical protein